MLGLEGLSYDMAFGRVIAAAWEREGKGPCGVVAKRNGGAKQLTDVETPPRRQRQL